MTLPLKATVTSGRTLELQQLKPAELALLRYNLRCSYAAHLNGNGTGVVRMGDTGSNGPEFGRVINVERTQTNEGPHPHARPTGVVTGNNDTPYSYRQSTGSAAPTTFTNSYASYNLVSSTELEIRQERSINNIVDAVLTDCINEMRTGDEIGTYRVDNINSPPTGGVWADKGLWFIDTIYAASTVNTYNLYLKLSGTAPIEPLVSPVVVRDDGTIETVSIGLTSPLYLFLLDILKSRVSASLTYDIGVGMNRGNFIETRFSTTTISHPGPSAGDDYRTTATPSGTINMTTYYLGLI